MKTLIWILIFIAILAFAGGMNLSIKPLSISFPRWPMMLAILFFSLGLSFYGLQNRKDGINKGRDLTIEALKRIAADRENDEAKEE